ncbi:MAG: hypothetical protein NWF07_09735, partial [Candidatus Bathyarchaeota archaeon]|nr:hypothetical protein [Candidatus Bathyarchaeota archaeon]
ATIASEFKNFFNTEKSKNIIVPPGMELSPEMQTLLERAKNEEVFIDPLVGNGGEFTIARDSSGIVKYTDRHQARVLGSTVNDKGETIIRLNQLQSNEHVSKFAVGTDKATVSNWIPREVLELAGIDADVVVASNVNKSSDWNNIISSQVNYGLDAAKDKYGLYDEALTPAQRKRAATKYKKNVRRAFKDYLGIDVEFGTVKRTVGGETRDHITTLIPDFSVLGEGGVAKTIAGAKGDGIITGQNLAGFVKRLGGGDIEISKEIAMNGRTLGNILYGIQDVNPLDVGKWTKPYGGNVGLDHGVKYTPRELEMIRNTKIRIGGQEYKSSGTVLRFLHNTIEEKANLRYENKTVKKQLGGAIARSMDSAAGIAQVKDGEAIIRTRYRGDGPGDFFLLDMDKTNLDAVTRREDLIGGVLNPENKNPGYWFELPVDVRLNGKGEALNKLYIYKEGIGFDKGSFRATESQGVLQSLERASRDYMLALENKMYDSRGRIVDIDKTVGSQTVEEITSNAIARIQYATENYVQLAGKNALGAGGIVNQHMLSGKVGNSAHFTLTQKGSAYAKDLQGITGYISEEYARGMLA